MTVSDVAYTIYNILLDILFLEIPVGEYKITFLALIIGGTILSFINYAFMRIFLGGKSND